MKKWYLQTWFLCLLFAFSYFIVPLIIGVCLLVLSIKEDKKIKLVYLKCERIEELEQEETCLKKRIENLQRSYIDTVEQEDARLKKEIENRQIEYEKINQSYIEIKERYDDLYNEIAERVRNDINRKCEVVIRRTDEFKKKYETLQEEYSKSEEEYNKSEEEYNKSEKAIAANANKLLRAKALLKSVQYSAKRFFDYEAVSKDMLNESLPDEVDDLLSTTIKLKLNLLDVRELRKRYNQNSKVIKELLTKYQSRSLVST